MIYGSVCSGIEAATVAWHPLGWEPAFFSEIDDFPRAVLQHHYPEVPLHGDFTTIEQGDYRPIDLLVGGTPCQSFSIAGLRGGLGDDRGNLALEYLRLADRLRSKWLVWENVPGVLSSNGGRDFGSILGGMVELGYGIAYRILDAQYVRTCAYPWAVPQRRRRVFVVGYLGDWRRAAAVLFDRESLQGNPPPRREAGKIAAPTLAARTRGGGGLGTDFDLDGGLVAADVASTLNAAFGDKQGLEDQHVNAGCPLFVATVSGEGNAHALRGEGFDASDDGAAYTLEARTRSQAVAYGLTTEQTPKFNEDCALTLTKQSPSGGGQPQAVAFAQNSGDEVRMLGGNGDIAGALAAEPGMKQQTYLAERWAVRRLTPREAERLQGFPDGFTNIPWRGKDHAPDGRRYKALGNSMAVPVMQWLGERIQMVEDAHSGAERRA